MLQKLLMFKHPCPLSLYFIFTCAAVTVALSHLRGKIISDRVCRSVLWMIIGKRERRCFWRKPAGKNAQGRRLVLACYTSRSPRSKRVLTGPVHCQLAADVECSCRHERPRQRRAGAALECALPVFIGYFHDVEEASSAVSTM